VSCTSDAVSASALQAARESASPVIAAADLRSIVATRDALVSTTEQAASEVGVAENLSLPGPVLSWDGERTSFSGEEDDLIGLDPVFVQESDEGAGDCAGVAAVLGEGLG
jgi:hypothetical protein